MPDKKLTILNIENLMIVKKAMNLYIFTDI
jgi:hypothetical protein